MICDGEFFTTEKKRKKACSVRCSQILYTKNRKAREKKYYQARKEIIAKEGSIKRQAATLLANTY